MLTNRHRIPSIFSLSMVDVLCCALGCVILLWLVNLRQARRSGSELTNTQMAVADLRSQLQSTEDEKDDLTLALRMSQTNLAEVESNLAVVRKTAAALDTDLSTARTRGADLEAMLRKKEAQAVAARGTVRDLEARLRTLEDREKELRAQADLVPGLRADVRAYREKTASLEKDVAAGGKSMQDLELVRVKLTRDLAARDKELAAAGVSLERLNTEKQALKEQAGRLRLEMDSRFAGIALTGRNVVFLVDMSGSMELVDPQTAAPNKWIGVRESLVKVMRSLPALEKFQVILFSNKVIYPFGNEGDWLTYEGPATAERVLQTLADKKFKPKGGTDMYAGLEAAFRLRAAALDTVYFFSDGLPNQGQGMTAEQAETLSETQKGEILGKYVRKTLASDWNRPIAGKARVRINAIGFFYESPDVGAFLWALSRDNDGSFVGMSKP